MPTAPYRTLFYLLLCSLIVASCSGPKRAETLKREDLFHVGYGTSETELDFSSPASEHFDADMREGIFLFLDSGSRKIMKLTSYGDLLSLIYDPSSLDVPKALANPASLAEEAAGSGGSPGKKGRSAFATFFVEPSKLALDSVQTIYVADRLKDPAARVFDAQSAAYCDRVVRRFKASGAEAEYLGQEGPGGTPFPFITSLFVLDDDSLVVISTSESLYLVHRFTQAGNLLSSMRISRSALPLPKALGKSGTEDSSVFASLDTIVPEFKGGTFDILMKIDYYKRAGKEAGGPNQGIGYAGSRVINVDGKTGGYGDIIDVSQRGEDEDIPELLGQWNDRLYLISRVSSESGEGDPGWRLQSLDRSGRIRGRYKLIMPMGSTELVAFKLSSGGQIFGLAKKKGEAAVFWWRLVR